MTTDPQGPYFADLVRELERIVNGMASKVSELDPDYKPKARAEGKWRVVSLSDRPKLGGVRSGIAYDPRTDSYVVVCDASTGVPPRRYGSFNSALEFARTGHPRGGMPVVTSTTSSSDPTGDPRVGSIEQDLSRGEHPSASEALFESLVERIERAYEQLDHRLGWRFLYTPRRTLAAQTRLLFVGANPGGSNYECPSPSVEAGNAYRVETHWAGEGGGANPLQIQVRLLYEELARKLGRDDTTLLMDETLASNFCPFRSPSWQALPNKARSISFSKELWRAALQPVERPAIICNGKDAFPYFCSVLEDQGASLLGAPEVGLIGWGEHTYEVARYDRAMIVTFPHLSRFRIVGRPESQQAVERIVSAAAAAVCG